MLIGKLQAFLQNWMSGRAQSYVPYLEGPPGVGKTYSAHAAGAAMSKRVYELRPATMDIVDLVGVPFVERSGPIPLTMFARPEMYPSTAGCVIVIDELAQSPEQNQPALSQLIRDRRAGPHALPPDCLILATGNRVKDMAGASRLLSHIANRLGRLSVETSAEDWQEWALHHAVRPEVRAYLKWRPDALLEFDPASNPPSFPSPRSWEYVSDAMSITSPDDEIEVFSGLVGETRGGEFGGFLGVCRALPDVAIIKASPKTAPVPDEPSTQYALSAYLGDVCRKADAAALTAVCQYASRLPEEAAVLFFRSAPAMNPAARTDSAWKQWVKDHRGMVNEAASAIA